MVAAGGVVRKESDRYGWAASTALELTAAAAEQTTIAGAWARATIGGASSVRTWQAVVAIALIHGVPVL
jgi:hypothetical protein